MKSFLESAVSLLVTYSGREIISTLSEFAVNAPKIPPIPRKHHGANQSKHFLFFLLESAQGREKGKKTHACLISVALLNDD